MGGAQFFERNLNKKAAIVAVYDGFGAFGVHSKLWHLRGSPLVSF